MIPLRRPSVIEAMRVMSEPIRHPVFTALKSFWHLRGLPRQSLQEIRFCKAALSWKPHGKLRIFEWGMGLSTIYYPAYLRSLGRDVDWYAVDNSREWYEWVRQRARTLALDDTVHLACMEFPPFWMVPGYAAGQPIGLNAYPQAESVLRYLSHPRTLGGSFDVMLIDGRFRRRCLLEARAAVSHDGLVLLHDAHRTHYHPALSVYPSGRFIRGGRYPGSLTRSLVHSDTWVGSIGPVPSSLIAAFSSTPWNGDPEGPALAGGTRMREIATPADRQV